jgi:uncharacterized protein (TIGR04255 family)
MSRRMANPPVFYTVVQVQHNALLNLGNYLAPIQERMRKAGFPDFKRITRRQINLTFLADGNTQPIASPAASEDVNSFMFEDISNTGGFVLQPTSLYYHTTAYDTFEEFLDRIRFGLTVLNEAVGGVDFTERLGLRYVDAVMLTADETMKDYLAPEVLGLPWSLKRQEKPEAKFGYSFTESLMIEDDVGQVVCRAIVQNGRIGFPPDVATSLKLFERFSGYEGEHAIIDTDASYSVRQPFDVDTVEAHLHSLHGLIEKTFHGSVTPHALQVWRGEVKT